MIELLILWNIAAARADQQEENTDFTYGVIAAWVMLQVLIWPISVFALLMKLGMRWLPSLITASAFTIIGYLIGGESFYFVLGFIAVFAAASLVAKSVVWDA
jgi:hypothetical protein